MLPESICEAIKYADENGVDVSTDLRIRARRVGAIKAGDDLSSINRQYHDAITGTLTNYFEKGGAVAPFRNVFRRSMVDAFGMAFDLGWEDGGAEGYPEGDALEWFNARVEQEFGYIASVFEQAKGLRKEEDFDYFAWVTARADGFTRTINDIYNMGVLFASKNKMLTFDGADGSPDNICQKNNGTCVKLKGKRHKASWWISHGLVPYRGNPNYDCGAWECRHFLRDDEGNKFTL